MQLTEMTVAAQARYARPTRLAIVSRTARWGVWRGGRLRAICAGLLSATHEPKLTFRLLGAEGRCGISACKEAYEATYLSNSDNICFKGPSS